VAFGKKALRLARALGQQEIESHALNNIGSARLVAGDQCGEESLLQALQIALDHDLHEHAARAYVNLCSTGTVSNNLRARRYLETTHEAAPGLHRGQKVCPTREMF
jgi:hypothetical protein